MQVHSAIRPAVRFGNADAQLDTVVNTLLKTVKVIGPSTINRGLTTTVEFNGKKYDVTASRSPYGSNFSAVREDGNVEIEYSVNSRGFAPTKVLSYTSSGNALSTRSPQVTDKMDKLVGKIWQEAKNPSSGDLDV